MEEVNITELESRYFSDLFACCDIEKTGKVPVLKATEMFRSSNISDDILKNIMSMANIPQAALYMSKVQFYSCLKLIAAHQSAIPLRQELIASTISLPLPKFSWKTSPVQLHPDGGGGGGGGAGGLNGKINDVNRWRSNDDRSPNLIELARADAQSDIANSDITSTDSEVEPNETEKKLHTRRAGSPDAWSTASDSPTPTNSVAERPWAKNALWQGQLEERTQLLGTEEESSDRHSSDEENDIDLEAVYQITPEQKEYYIKQFRTIQPDLKGLISGQAAKIFFEKSRIPVEELRHIWQLCDVTKDGALSLPEFAAAMHLVVARRNNIPLPPILPECLIPNSKFFDSCQPAEADLLHLDDDKEQIDGNLASNNNNNNSISSSGKTNPILSDVHNSSFIASSSSSSSSDPKKHASSSSNSSLIGSHTGNNRMQTAATTKQIPHANSNSNKDSTSSSSPVNDSEISPTKSAKSIRSSKEWTNQGSKEWTKFTESPTSNVSSPGPKPVNFDMQRTAQAVVSDPQILHPVPLRITPVTNDTNDDETNRSSYQRKSDSNYVYEGGIITIRDADTSSPKQQQFTVQRDSGIQNDLRAIQRPQPKKITNKNSIGAIPPPPQRESLTMNNNVNNNNETIDTVPPTLLKKQEIPPPPPPRPQKHARSSSLDLNKLKLNGPVPPEVPPRVSPHMTAQTSLDAQLETGNSPFADFTQFPEETDASRNQPQSLENDDSLQLPSRPIAPSFQSSQRSSAFEVYRKPTPRESISPPDSLATKSIDAPHSHRITNLHKTDSKNLSDVMCHLKEQNQSLITICNDLSDELLTVQQKKADLLTKIENECNSSGQHNSLGVGINNQSTV